MSDILDYHVQHHLRRYISKLPANQQYQLRNIKSCGQSLMKLPAYTPGVSVLSDGENGKFFGQTHCQNAFCCPVCSARIMEKVRSKIASGIEMFKADGYFGFMVSFAIPHLKFMSCRETTDILFETWTRFRTKNYTKSWHVYQEFCKEVPIAHWVRVTEYTYGQNGWHPHFHAIFWTKRENRDKILKWQYSLNQFWLKMAKGVTLRYWQKNNLHQGEDLVALADRLYKFAGEENYSLGLCISQKDGKVAESNSSDYLTGWGADREVTANVRKEASHDGHYTPYQILTMAENDVKYEKLYIEFCLAVTRKPVHHRYNFSKTGIVKAIEDYQSVHGYESVVIQKKRTWEVIAFFNEEQWSELLCFNESAPVLSNILYLAGKHTDLLFEYLESLGFKRRDCLPRPYNVRIVKSYFCAA